MYEWRRQIQQIVDEIDGCIRSHDDAALTLRSLSRTLGYSEYYTTRKFREISGMQLRDYLRRRRLAFALREVRDSERSLLDIALDYGFSTRLQGRLRRHAQRVPRCAEARGPAHQDPPV